MQHDGVRPDRYLLKDQAVAADLSPRVNDDPVGVRDQQAAADPAVDRDVGAGHRGPEAMPQDHRLARAIGAGRENVRLASTSSIMTGYGRSFDAPFAVAIDKSNAPDHATPRRKCAGR